MLYPLDGVPPLWFGASNTPYEHGHCIGLSFLLRSMPGQCRPCPSREILIRALHHSTPNCSSLAALVVVNKLVGNAPIPAGICALENPDPVAKTPAFNHQNLGSIFNRKNAPGQ